MKLQPGSIRIRGSNPDPQPATQINAVRDPELTIQDPDLIIQKPQHYVEWKQKHVK